MNKELDDKLALMVNGQLDEQEAVALEEQIKDDAELGAEADFLKALQSGIKNQSDTPPGAAGLARLMRDIESEQAQVKPQDNASARPAPITKQTIKVQAAANSSNFWKPISIAACCLLAMQSFFVMQDNNHNDPSSVVTLSGHQAAAGPQLQVVFSDTATAAQIRESLLGINANLVGGPGALGIYTVQLPPGSDLAQAQMDLINLPFIEEVEAVVEANSP